MSAELHGRASVHQAATALSAAGVIVEDRDGRINEVNAAAAELLGYDPTELVGLPFSLVCAHDDADAQATLRRALFAGDAARDEGRRRYRRKDGEIVECHAAIVVVGDAVLSVLHPDATFGSAEARQAKERLRMLGLFAAGIAHDFNNVLSIIRCNAEFARDALTTRPADLRAAVADLGEVDRASERASGLVRQLLAFAGRQARHPQRLDLNEIVREAASFLRVSVGNEIQVVLRLAPTLPSVLADRSQIDQVMMNLVLNARDAIAEAIAADGATSIAALRAATLTITTTTEYIGPTAVSMTGVPNAGDYIRVDVRDTGAGMSEETRVRLFEPFFTTKPLGSGTGLGLAATWGIVVQSGGSIRVETERARGTTFRVYLPVAGPEPDIEPAAAPAATTGATGADESEPRPRNPDGPITVLLAEDDHAVRRVASRILRSAGYRVLEAGDGASALDLWEGHGREIDVLVADVRMPRLRGDALAVLLAAQRPGLPIVLMTGFGDEPSEVEGDGSAGAQQVGGPPLAKPFAAAALLERVTGALAGATDGARSGDARA